VTAHPAPRQAQAGSPPANRTPDPAAWAAPGSSRCGPSLARRYKASRPFRSRS